MSYTKGLYATFDSPLTEKPPSEELYGFLNDSHFLGLKNSVSMHDYSPTKKTVLALPNGSLMLYLIWFIEEAKWLSCLVCWDLVYWCFHETVTSALAKQPCPFHYNYDYWSFFITNSNLFWRLWFFFFFHFSGPWDMNKL